MVEFILDRLSQARGEAKFSADEIARWPEDITNIFKMVGILQPAQPAQSVICPGCEYHCNQPIYIIPAEGDLPGRAFLSCDKRDDVGRVPIPLNNLMQWYTTGAFFAAALAKLLDLTASSLTTTSPNQWPIGIIHGKKRKQLILLMLADEKLTVSLAGHSILLKEIIAIKKNTLTVAKTKLLYFINNPKGNTEKPEERRKRLIQSVNDEKYRGTRNFLATVAKEEGISISRLKQLIRPKPNN